MRVLMITQKVDRTDDVLGFTHDWVVALARHVEQLDVVALYVGDHDLPANVTLVSMGKERGRNRLGIAAGFYAGLRRFITQADAVFVHMIPRYAIMAAPLAALYRKPMTLWYTHRSASSELRAALRLVKHIATVHESSFPLPHAKVHAMGHGISLEVFHPDESLPEAPPLVVSLSRLSPIKRHETLIQAAAILRDKYGNPPVRFAIAGGSPDGNESAYPDFLRQEIERLRVADRVAMWGSIPSDGVVGVFHEAAIAFNGSPPGLFDKSALESMLCAVPTIVANAAFDDLLGDHVDMLRLPDGGDSEALAASLNALLQLTSEERRALGMQLSERVAAAHGLERLMDKLVALIGS